ncbi:MAG: hypothetical protein AAGI50_03885, partial [Pseudomonadota bacterium]
PVLSPAEAADHPHNLARHAFAPTGPDQPMPAPRFGQSETSQPTQPTQPDGPGAQTDVILADLGITAADIAALHAAGAVKQQPKETAP